MHSTFHIVCESGRKIPCILADTEVCEAQNLGICGVWHEMITTDHISLRILLPVRTSRSV